MELRVSNASGSGSGGTGGIRFGGVVAVYADLPAASGVANQVWYVTSSSGFWPLTYKPSGYYLSDGAVWTKWETDAAAMQALIEHEADTTTHGTTGDIVGTSDSQALTNKTIDYNQNNIINLPGASSSYATNFSKVPVESPDGTRVTFTLPFSHVARANQLTVRLNGVAYHPTTISQSVDRTQFTIAFPGLVPKTKDRITLDYDREV